MKNLKLFFLVLITFSISGAFTLRNDKGVLIDNRDNQAYEWIRLKDGKKWMAQNLNFKTDTEKDCKCYLSNLSNEEKRYTAKEEKCLLNQGRLYSWNAAQNSCPKNWRLPSNAEWSNMINQYGGYFGEGNYDNKGEKAFKSLKKKKNGNFFSFWNIAEPAFYWTSSISEKFDTLPDALGFKFQDEYSGNYISNGEFPIASLFNCRCIQD